MFDSQDYISLQTAPALQAASLLWGAFINNIMMREYC